MAGMATVPHTDPASPLRHELRDNAVTIAEAFRDAGWATFMIGKWHLTKDAHLSDGAPKASWPLQRGFDRFYGILDAFTNFHQPHRLCADNHHIDVDDYPDGYYFTDDLTDQPCAWWTSFGRRIPPVRSSCTSPTARCTPHCRPPRPTSSGSAAASPRAGTCCGPSASSASESWA